MSNQSTTERAVVFGLGQIFGEIQKQIFSQFDVVALTDSDPTKQGSLMEGYTVIAPKDLAKIAFDKVVIATQVYQKQVVAQLLEFGVEPQQIILGVNYLMKEHKGREYRYHVSQNGEIRCGYSTDHSSVVLIENPDFRWLVSSHDAVLVPCLANGENYSEEGIGAFFSLAKEKLGRTEGVFLDIGANIGTTALRVSTYTGVSRVIAVEPSSSNYSLLQSNIHLNGLHGKVMGVHAAASDRNDIVQLGISSDSPCHHQIGGGSLPKQDTATEAIRSVTIDSLVEGQEPSHIGFLWVDVQGYEYFVLKGAEKLIRSNKQLAVWIEFWPRGLRATHSLDLLVQFCVEHFRGYVDAHEYLAGHRITHPIEKMSELGDVYTRNSYTDLFLIP